MTFSRAVLYRVVGGKLTVLRQIGDNFGLFQQLGGLPPAVPALAVGQYLNETVTAWCAILASLAGPASGRVDDTPLPPW